MEGEQQLHLAVLEYKLMNTFLRLTLDSHYLLFGYFCKQHNLANKQTVPQCNFVRVCFLLQQLHAGIQCTKNYHGKTKKNKHILDTRDSV